MKRNEAFLLAAATELLEPNFGSGLWRVVRPKNVRVLIYKY
jgi:hypothetical protein